MDEVHGWYPLEGESGMPDHTKGALTPEPRSNCKAAPMVSDCLWKFVATSLWGPSRQTKRHLSQIHTEYSGRSPGPQHIRTRGVLYHTG